MEFTFGGDPMPWQEATAMSLRHEFVTLAAQQSVSLRELCRRFSISPPTGYKWLRRYEAEPAGGLADRSRRPHHAPGQTPPKVEAAVLTARREHPAWGGRKLRRWLLDRGQAEVPQASTISAILRRNGLLAADQAAPHAWQRFEHPAPNDLWQMDFKGHFALPQGRCHPLTVLDDHSRYNLELAACNNEQHSTVHRRLTGLFERYGLPWAMTMDNGSPWGSDAVHRYTTLTVWLIHLGIQVSHSAPFHPQTQGKLERFHRSLKAEVISVRAWRDLAECQAAFTAWRTVYNHERPHEALGLATPASRYQPSGRAFPTALPPIEYGPDDHVRRVDVNGAIMWRGQKYRLGRAFVKQPVALRPTVQDGVWEVYFCHECIRKIDLHQGEAQDV
jgi:transposase InsO family protein